MNKKSEIRKHILNKRKSLSQKEVMLKSDSILKHLINYDLFSKSQNISCYYPYRNEVGLLQLLDFNKNILFPKVIENSRILDFYLVKSVSDFKKGAFGIMEPITSLPKIEISDIDLFLAPGVGFSKNGERIGYGGGYYDTTLKLKNNNSKVIGICFELQIVPPGFSDPWDQKIDSIINESEIIYCKRR